MQKTLNINEACKLAKNLAVFKNELSYMLIRKEYIYDITEEHLKKNSNPEAENVTKTNKDLNPNKYDITADEIVDLMWKITEAKAKLSKAIEDEKNKISIDVGHATLNLDSAIEYNKGLRSFIEGLTRLSNTKESVVETKGQDYKFDNEGKQTAYYYTIKTTVKPTFNKDKVRDQRKELKALADRISIDIDKAKLNASITIDTEFDIHDTLEDVISNYVSKNRTKEA